MGVVASGSVGDRPFGRTIAAVSQRQFTGELRLTANGQVYTIGWRGGDVVAAAGNHPADSAVKTAMSAGLITSTQASAILRSVSAGVDDVALVAESTRLGPDNVGRLRRRVIANRAMRLFAFEDGQFVLDDVLTLDVPPDLVPIDARVILFQGVRAHFSEDRARRELATFGGTFQLDAELADDDALAGYGFGQAELPVIEALRSPISLTALVGAAPSVESRVAHAVLYALVMSGLAQPVSPAIVAPASQTSSGAIRLPASDPAIKRPRVTAPQRIAAPDELEKIRALVDARLADVDGGADHFHLLGVTQETPPEQVRAAYFEVARQLHPDRITATGLEDIRARAQKLFAQINAAFGVLSHPKKRAEYVQTLRAGGSAAIKAKEDEAEAAASKLFAAEDHFRAGEMALRRNQLDAAIAEFQKALALNPEEAEHHAMLAWAQWCAAPDKVAAAKPARAALDKAVQISPKNPLAHVLLGKIARSIDEDDAAVRHFKRALELSPHHGEASSELRIVEARVAQKPAAPSDKKPGGGLFGRFKR